jgi:hypothetical protein
MKHHQFLSDEEIVEWLKMSVKVKLNESNDLCVSGYSEQTLEVKFFDHAAVYMKPEQQCELLRDALFDAEHKGKKLEKIWVSKYMTVENLTILQPVMYICKMGVSLDGVYVSYPFVDILEKLCSMAPTEDDFRDSLRGVKALSEFWNTQVDSKKARFDSQTDHRRYQAALKQLVKINDLRLDVASQAMSALGFAYQNDILYSKDTFYTSLPWAAAYIRAKCVLDSSHMGVLAEWFARAATKTHGGYNFVDGCHAFDRRVSGKTFNIFYEEISLAYAMPNRERATTQAIGRAMQRVTSTVVQPRAAFKQTECN